MNQQIEILGIDAQFEHRGPWLDGHVGKREPLRHGDTPAAPDQVDFKHDVGDPVLHLNADLKSMK